MRESIVVICPTAQGDGLRQINATGKIIPLGQEAGRWITSIESATPKTI